MKYLIFILMFVLCFIKTEAQDNDTNKVFFIKKYYLKQQAKAVANAKKFDTYRVTGLSLGYASTQDTRMALPIYSGASLGANVSWREFSEKWYSELNFEFAYTNPSFEGGSLSSYTHLRMLSNMSFLRKLNQNKFYLGAGIHFVDGLRIYGFIGNSSFNNDLVVSINPELKYQSAFSLFKRQFNYYTGISINGFSYVNRTPSFATGLDGAHNYFAPIGQFNRVRMATGLHWRKRFSQENRMGLEYSWDFYSLNENDGQVKLRSAQHLISLNYWFKTR
ncbi:MAG: hypothetical protein JXQ87_01575 [Bacteroidia bacterium]